LQVAAKFHGVIPPVATLFDENGRFDAVNMGRLIDYLIDNGVDGLFFLGSGGEFSELSPERRMEIAEFAVRHVAGRVPVLIGTGGGGAEQVIRLSEHSRQIGADAVVVINPYYFSLSEANLFRYYAEVARAVDLPVLLYNYPARTGQDLAPSFVAKLAETFPNIVGIKETVFDFGHIREMIAAVHAVRPDFAVFSGFDDQFLNTLLCGGAGAISASANFAPELEVGLYRAFRRGDAEEMIRWQRKLIHVAAVYSLVSPFVGAVKEAIRIRALPGISTYSVSGPMDGETRERLERMLERIGADW